MSPSSISQLSRGNVVLVRFPFTDLTSAKRRPAVVVTDTTTVTGTDGHFIFMGTQLPAPREPSIQILEGSPEATAAGLKFQPGVTSAFILPKKIATLDVALVSRRLGSLSPALLAQVDRHLKAILGL